MSHAPSVDTGESLWKMTGAQWLICAVAALGFAFDIYELLMMPLIAPASLAYLLKVDPNTASGAQAILAWTQYILLSSAVCGGIFGLLGGYLTDRFGRRKVLVWSILLYAFSAGAAGFAESPMVLLVLRCTTFIGVCVEFVAAVAWLSELFPNPKQREAVLGYTQAFSSVGGLMVTGAYYICVHYGEYFPAINGSHDAWRYTLISGLLPAIPLIIIRPFMPESPAWAEKKLKGTLRRPSFTELFAPQFRQTTIVTAVLFACSYGAAFGAIQLAPQVVPGLVRDADGKPALAAMGKLRTDYENAVKEGASPETVAALKAKVVELNKLRGSVVSTTQTFQELGGLLGRFVLAFLAVRIASRRTLLRVFQIPALFVIPLLFYFPGRSDLTMFQWGLGLAGFLVVAQFSFWGNYLPRMYPTHLRGTGESFAANVGGRMVGTMAIVLTTQLASVMSDATPPGRIALAAATVGLLVYVIAIVVTFWLPEPDESLMHD